MATYSYAQLEQLWINNGGSKVTAPVAAAVALAESSGNAGATSANPDGGTNAGLWQLDTPGGKGAGYSVAALQDPNTNARVAVAGSSGGQDWSAWQTYTQGTYKQYLNGSTTPDPNVPASAELTSSQGGSDCLTGTFPHTSWCLLKKSQARALIGGLCMAGGLVITGLGLALVAAFALQRTGIAQTVVNLTPAGRVLNAVPGPKPAAP